MGAVVEGIMAEVVVVVVVVVVEVEDETKD
jgi:hypothetical protein